MTRFEKWSVWVTSLLTTVTGVVYLWMKYFLEIPDPWSVINHPLQPLVLKLHILVAPMLIFAIGLITLRHVWRHFRSGARAGRRSGIVTALLVTPMVITGYLIQAVTHQGWLRSVVIGHIVFGVIYALGLAVHQVAVRRGGGNGEPWAKNGEDGDETLGEGGTGKGEGSAQPRHSVAVGR